MELTQEDYEERKRRVMDARASDEDRRLVKLYESQGFMPARLRPAEAPESVDPGDAPDGDPGTGVPNDEDDQPLPRPPLNANRDAWVAFAVAFNDRCDPGDQPIGDPTGATKADLVEAYKSFGEPPV